MSVELGFHPHGGQSSRRSSASSFWVPNSNFSVIPSPNSHPLEKREKRDLPAPFISYMEISTSGHSRPRGSQAFQTLQSTGIWGQALATPSPSLTPTQ